MTRRPQASDVTSTVLDLSELAALGVSAHAAQREVRRGRWQRGADGTYVTHDQPLSDSELLEVVRHHVGTPAVVTGHLVLPHLGLRWVPSSDLVHALVPVTCRTRSSGLVRVTRTKDLDALDTWSAHDCRMADAERAVYDAARAADGLRDVRGLVLGAVADGWATADGLLGLVAAGRRNGSALVRRAAADAARGAASPPEAELVDALVGRRTPFLVNPALLVDGTLLGYPDLYLPGLGLCAEVQSKERHGSEEQEESTYDRAERFEAAGLTVVHLSVRRIRADPQECARHLLARARERARLPAHLREPAGLEVRPRSPLLR
jgi:hypothetical protein